MPDRPSLAPLLAVNFVGTLGFSIVTPFLVILVVDWGGNALVYGVVAATYSAFQLIGAPVLGRWSDQVGRRRVLLISQAGTLVSWGVFLIAFYIPKTALMTIEGGILGAFTVTLPLVMLFVARAFDGLTGGNVSVSNAYLADITDEQDRARNFGRMAVSSNLGFVVGPALAGLLGATALGSVVPVIAAFAISAVALALIQFTLRDVTPASIPEPLEDPNACDLYGQEHKPAYAVACARPDSLLGVLRKPGMPGLMGINFLVMLGFSVFYVAFPVHAVQGLGWDVTAMGGFFAVLSLAMIVVQGPVLQALAPRIGDTALMVGGGIVLAAGFALLVLPSTVGIYAAGLLVALGNGLMWPTFMGVLSKAAGTVLQGAVQGYAQSFGAVASIAGLIAGGALYLAFGALLFVVASGIILAAAGLALLHRSDPPDATPVPA